MTRRELRCLHGLLLCTVLCCSAGWVRAQIGVGSAATVAASEPERVVVRLDPTQLDEQQASELLSLLEADLGQQNIALAHEFGAGRASRWFSRSELSNSLLLVALTGGKDGGWRVVLIDPTRRLGAARTLPGGSGNAANVEAVASIVVAAAIALAEGRDVVSSPMEEVLQEEPATTVADEREAPVPEEDQPVESRPRSPVDDPWSGTFARSPRTTWLTLDAGGTLSTFEPSVPWVLETTASAGVALRDRLTLELGVRQHRGSLVESAYGSFELSRWAFWLGGGPSWHSRDWVLSSQVSGAAELLSRSRTEPGPGIEPNPGRPLVRFGGRVAGTARWAAVGPVGLRVTVFGTWFPRPIRMTATGSREVVAEPWLLGFGAFTGLSLWL